MAVDIISVILFIQLLYLNGNLSVAEVMSHHIIDMTQLWTEWKLLWLFWGIIPVFVLKKIMIFFSWVNLYGQELNWEPFNYEARLPIMIFVNKYLICFFYRYFSQGTIEERDYVTEVCVIYLIFNTYWCRGNSILCTLCMKYVCHFRNIVCPFSFLILFLTQASCKQRKECCLLLVVFPLSVLKTEAVYSFEIPVILHQTAWHGISEHSHLMGFLEWLSGCTLSCCEQ
jgi:hypothetical protein